MSRGGVLLFSLLALLCILSLPGSSPTEPLQEAGAGPDSGEHLSPHEAQPPSAGSPRADTSRNWMVRFVLLPMTLFFLLILCWGLRGSSKTPGLKLAAALSLLMGAAAVWTVLPAPASVALLRDVNFRDGVDSMEVLGRCDFDLGEWESDESGARRAFTWTDPSTALRVVCDVRKFAAFPAFDWVLSFENTPILEDMQALDLHLNRAQGDVFRV